MQFPAESSAWMARTETEGVLFQVAWRPLSDAVLSVLRDVEVHSAAETGAGHPLPKAA
jgi:hypothetical protein